MNRKKGEDLSYLYSLLVDLLLDKVHCLVGVHQLVSLEDTVKESSALKDTGQKCICTSLFISPVFWQNTDTVRHTL